MSLSPAAFGGIMKLELDDVRSRAARFEIAAGAMNIRGD
jgi:hypothetical protein